MSPKSHCESCWELLQREHQRIHHGLADPAVPLSCLMSFLASAPLGVFSLQLLRRMERTEDTALVEAQEPGQALHLLRPATCCLSGL